MQNILTITEWDLPIPTGLPLTTSGSSGGAGGTITTTSSSIYISSALPVISAKSAMVTNNLDDFFGNIFSTLDVFAQILNLIYLSPPMSEAQVSFLEVVNAISALPVPKDPIRILLNGCMRASLHVNANKYRSTSTHRNALYFKVLTEIDPFALVQSPPKIVAILIADDPKVTPLTYLEKRDFRSFGPRVLQHTQAVINSAYRIMEQTTRTVDQIPV